MGGGGGGGGFEGGIWKKRRGGERGDGMTEGETEQVAFNTQST